MSDQTLRELVDGQGAHVDPIACVDRNDSYLPVQVEILRRQDGAWPPERGGDTW